jgi:hypothetical protein
MLALGVPRYSLGSTVTLTFDEFGTSTPIDANGVSIDGLTFGFTGGSATYNGSIGAMFTTENLSDPELTGDTVGTLTLSWAVATTFVDFDIALETLAPIADGYDVNLSYQGTPVLSQSYSTNPIIMYSEDAFSYSGSPVDSASITFYNGQDPYGSPGQDVTAFALDNLSFDPADTPEPGTVFLMFTGLVSLGMLWRRRTQRVQPR